ncbi:hypothetical protein FQN60_016722 [Etheostoma spectabile]|uniref:HAT C-terminal dimerisation domain-containing protein n=1 Tax=Etheostoma spectabile TaxID=54343 RepID=A0A5J5D4L4_9PERO|nr:hypothetical protein FQN60_016722 [Etheostoma spectabile]
MRCTFSEGSDAWNDTESRGTPTCLICTEKVAVYKEYNIRRHYSTRHAEEYTKYQGDERKNRVANLKKCLLRQQDLFKEANKEKKAAVEASYVVSEMIAKAGKPFKEGKFIKKRFAGITTDGAPSMTGRKNGLVALVQIKLETENVEEVSGNADKLGQFLRELPPTFPELSRMFKRTMCLFGSTYLCEKLFSTRNFNESKYRSRITDGHLQAILRVSTVSSLMPNGSQLCERKRCQVSVSKE